MNASTSATRELQRYRASRRGAVFGGILIVGAVLSACTADESLEVAVPTPTPPAEQPTVAPVPAASGELFVVGPFDGPQTKPAAGGTTHRYANPHRDAVGIDSNTTSDYRWIEYTVPEGWEQDDIYIGKNLGEPNEVAVSFWTTAGVYPDPCRRSAELSPLDLTGHGHPDMDTISLASYPELGLSAQHGREASEPRSVVIEDPTDERGTLALRIELTIPADLDVASCDDGVYRAWPGFDVGHQSNDNHVAGQTDIIYQVDVDLTPLIIDASFRADSSPEDIEELYSVIGSIVMDRW
jgi:hypothetical protein